MIKKILTYFRKKYSQKPKDILTKFTQQDLISDKYGHIKLEVFYENIDTYLAELLKLNRAMKSDMFDSLTLTHLTLKRISLHTFITDRDGFIVSSDEYLRFADAVSDFKETTDRLRQNNDSDQNNYTLRRVRNVEQNIDALILRIKTL